MLASESGQVAREEILERLRERIVRFAASRLQGDNAEDLAQEVLIVLHEKYAHLGRLEDLVPVAFEILRLKIVAARRKAIRRGEYTAVGVDTVQVADPAAGPEMAAEQMELQRRLIAAIGDLGSRCRRMMALKLEGRSFAEIQKIMGAASINTVYTWDFRCRKELLKLMGGAWEKR